MTLWAFALDEQLRRELVAGLALGRRELGRNGTRVSPAYDALVAMFATGNGQERSLLAAHDQLAEPVAVSYEEAGRRLGGISKSTVRRLVARGELEGVNAGRRRLILLGSVNEFGGRRQPPGSGVCA